MMSPRKRRRAPKILYSRELPGGGYVTIQSELVEDASWRGWISVERRADRNRREGDSIPVIAEMEGPSSDSIYQSLHSIASDNVAVATALRAWEASHQPAKS